MTDPDEVERIVIPYQPRWYQRELHQNLKRFNVLVWHRRAGKTVAAINELIRQACICTKPNPRVHYVAPTYSQAKRIAFQYLKEFTHDIPGRTVNEGELRIGLPNDAEIQLLGAEKYDSHRGIYSDFAVFDEPALQPPGVFGEVFRPALADREGGAIWVGTPAGRANEFFRRWQDSSKLAGWMGSMLKITDTGALPIAELKAMRAEMSEREWRQEMMCDFAAGVRGSYYQDELDFLEKSGRICEVPHDPALRVITSWDLGLDDQTVVHYWQQAGREHRMIDVDSFRNKSLSVIAKTVLMKPYIYERHNGPHDLAVREYSTGTSRFDFAASLGLEFEPNPPKASIEDGIQATRTGLRKTVIDRRACFDSIEALRIYRAEYDERRGVFRNKPFHGPESDYADSVRYYYVAEGDIQQGSLFGGPIDYSNQNRSVI